MEQFRKHSRQKCQRLLLRGRSSKNLRNLKENGVPVNPEAEAKDPGPFTYRELRDYLDNLTEAQLDQRAQLLPPNSNVGSESLLQPIYGIGTVEEMCHVNGEVCTLTHSTQDFQHHPEQIVLLNDYAPYDEEGNTYFTLEEGGMRGDKTGKLYEFGTNKPKKEKDET